jgi:AmiR/NasT family two-component response regulator
MSGPDKQAEPPEIVAPDLRELTEQLRTALASREIIHQALGIIMGQQRCTAHEGFELLRRASQNRNRPVYELAADIVESITGARADATPFVDPDL